MRVDVPEYKTFVDFPDDTSPDVIQKALSTHFPSKAKSAPVDLTGDPSGIFMPEPGPEKLNATGVFSTPLLPRIPGDPSVPKSPIEIIREPFTGESLERKAFKPGLDPEANQIKMPSPFTTEGAGRVLGTAGAGMVAAPVAGLTGMARGAETLLGKLYGMDVDPLTEANRRLEATAKLAPNLASTPTEEEALQQLMYAMKPFQMAGEGWKEIIGLTPLEGTIAEPIAGTIGEVSAMFALPGLPKRLGIAIENSTTFRRMTIPERGLVVKNLNEMLATGMPEAEILRKWNNPQWMAEAIAKRGDKPPANPFTKEAPAGEPIVPAAPVADMLPMPERGARLSNPVIAEAVVKSLREKLLPGPEGLDMANRPDFSIIPSRDAAEQIIRLARPALEGGTTRMLPAPPPSSPYSVDVADLLRKARELRALPYPANMGEGFVMQEPGEKAILRKKLDGYHAAAEPEGVQVEYKPKPSKAGTPFTTEGRARAAATKAGLSEGSFEVVPMGDGFGIKKAGRVIGAKPSPIEQVLESNSFDMTQPFKFLKMKLEGIPKETPILPTEKAVTGKTDVVFHTKTGRPFDTKKAADDFRIQNGLDKTHTVAPVTEIINDKYVSGYVVRPREAERPVQKETSLPHPGPATPLEPPIDATARETYQKKMDAILKEIERLEYEKKEVTKKHAHYRRGSSNWSKSQATLNGLNTQLHELGKEATIFRNILFKEELKSTIQKPRDEAQKAAAELKLGELTEKGKDYTNAKYKELIEIVKKMALAKNMTDAQIKDFAASHALELSNHPLTETYDTNRRIDQFIEGRKQAARAEVEREEQKTLAAIEAEKREQAAVIEKQRQEKVTQNARSMVKPEAPSEWKPAEGVIDKQKEVSQIEGILQRTLKEEERALVQMRDSQTFRVSSTEIGPDLLDLVRNSPAFSGPIRNSASVELIRLVGISRTEPSTVKIIKESKEPARVVTTFSSGDPIRKNLTGFYNDGGNLVATDGHRMIVANDAGKGLESGKIYVPRKGGGLDVLEDASFPDYKKVLPERTGWTAEIPKKSAEYIVSVIDATQKRNRLKSNSGEKELQYYNVTLPGGGEVSVNARYFGDALDALVKLGSDRILYQAAGIHNKPILLVGMKGKTEVAQAVVMPVKDGDASIKLSLDDMVGKVTRKGEQGPTFTSGIDPAQTLNVLRGLKNNIKEAMPHLENLGQRIYDSGKTNARDWLGGMKKTLGDLWESFKLAMRKVWEKVSKPLRNERGSVGKDIYEQNRLAQEKSVVKSAGKGLKDILGEISKSTDKYLGVISTRLGNIDPSLRNQLRKMEMRTGIEKAQYIRRVEPMLKKISKMSKEDKIDFDLARKNGDPVKLKELITKYDMWKEYTEGTRAVLNELYTKSKEVGFDVGYRKHFHPRIIKDPKGFLEYFYKQKDWPILERAIREKEAELGRYLEDNEKASLINSMLRGYKTGNISLSKPSQLKQREIETVTPELNKFYMNSDAALLRYITAVTDAVEMRKAFGVKAKGTIAPDDTIGHYILDLLAKGKIKPEHEPILRDIYSARFNEVGTRGLVGLYKNLSYIDTMGSFASAITQIGDLAWPLYRNGIIRTADAASKAIAGRSDQKKEDIGIDMIAREFSDTSKAASAVAKIFRIIGLEKIDNIGKETLINSTIKNAQRRAKNPNEVLKLEKELRPIFENETPELINDLREGRITENVKLLAFNTLSDFQPISLSEMPQKYLSGGNGRIFYMLKSFTIKQFDAFRREVFQKIKTPGTRVQGLKNLIRLAACFVAANASADVIKSLILGRDMNLDDLTVDNLLRLFGISKFVTWQARREGIGQAVVKQIAPPFKFLDAITKDIASAGDEKGLETVGSTPVVGKLYYWWFGKGAAKEERKALKNSDLSVMRRERAKMRSERAKERKAAYSR